MKFYDTRSIAWGLKPHEFSRLDPKVKKKLLRLMSRLAERSYRRGVQQGRVCCPSDEVAYKLRYERSLTFAPRVEDAKPIFTSSLDMMIVQNPVILELGLVEKKL